MIRVDSIPGQQAEHGPMLLVHGGAWAIPDEECAAHRQGVRIALETGKKGLIDGHAALDVVTRVVATMESDGTFDAGKGAVLNREGFVELDAGVMRGSDKHFGAVAGVRHFENPVKIAKRIILEGKRQFCFLAGEGAEKFARAQGLPKVQPEMLINARELARYERLKKQSIYHTSHPFLSEEDVHPRGTVGCVARDTMGRLAAATSTGGTPLSVPGRIGDSPMPGCGYYANETGAASATGWGEAIASVALCFDAVKRLASMDAGSAADGVIREMQIVIRNEEGQGATGGIILLSAKGEAAIAFSTPKMARGYWVAGEEAFVAVDR